MINVAENLNTYRSRILTTYRYLFDRTKEFKRHPILALSSTSEVGSQNSYCDKIFVFCCAKNQNPGCRKLSLLCIIKECLRCKVSDSYFRPPTSDYGQIHRFSKKIQATDL